MYDWLEANLGIKVSSLTVEARADLLIGTSFMALTREGRNEVKGYVYGITRKRKEKMNSESGVEPESGSCSAGRGLDSAAASERGARRRARV